MYDYSQSREWVLFTRAVAGVIRSIIYFDFNGEILTMSLNNSTNNSSYIMDSNGNYHKKEYVRLIQSISNSDWAKKTDNWYLNVFQPTVKKHIDRLEEKRIASLPILRYKKGGGVNVYPRV